MKRETAEVLVKHYQTLFLTWDPFWDLGGTSGTRTNFKPNQLWYRFKVNSMETLFY